MIVSALNRAETYDVNSSVPLSPEELSVLEEGEPVLPHKRHLLIAQTASPIAASTPFRTESLCNELSRCLVSSQAQVLLCSAFFAVM